MAFGPGTVLVRFATRKAEMTTTPTDQLLIHIRKLWAKIPIHAAASVPTSCQLPVDLGSS
jgi:hypothetical protein